MNHFMIFARASSSRLTQSGYLRDRAVCWSLLAYAFRSMSLTGIDPSLNGTALLNPNDKETQAALYEVKVFNITLCSVALCVLTVTGIISCISYRRHRRKCKRARVYESAVSSEVPEEPVGVMCVRKTHSFRNPLALFRRQEGPKDNSRIHYIYTNPLPVGHEEDRTPPQAVSAHAPLTLQDYASDPRSGIILAPPVFYMQL
ncbi:uncharacterized protein si:dkey-246e1.3 isoform X2 [Puntigrus tetrazona]|uniref:uncharacterized protein si:dkey-246e1.3 isoform X2 n=1 Tax=Puntigrus tetrazona TaxID=1606681 RepID=UPI001C8AD147|nr:uncharacterized protein si:dkey-246e1.3 isoform X2 [Puntigrus tetrazona]